MNPGLNRAPLGITIKLRIYKKNMKESAYSFKLASPYTYSTYSRNYFAQNGPKKIFTKLILTLPVILIESRLR
jgi:hypothetical protein